MNPKRLPIIKIAQNGTTEYVDGYVEIDASLFTNKEHDWYCGCGHWNGSNLAVCALCGRTPGESR